MSLIECCLKVPQPHDCGEIFESRKVKTSFNPEFQVNYCPSCRMYSYRWGRKGSNGIDSRNEQDVVKYIELSRVIIKQKHLENISRRKM